MLDRNRYINVKLVNLAEDGPTGVFLVRFYIKNPREIEGFQYSSY
jgi:hypothetical protein